MISDSRVSTYEHINEVRKRLHRVIEQLLYRALVHDETKLVEPELSGFNEVTDQLIGLTYGSKEYDECKAKLARILAHHYSNTKHHPESFPNGIKDMGLVDLIEMVCDWKSATLRHDDGDIYKSIELNQKRFGYSDELKQIFINTVKQIG